MAKDKYGIIKLELSNITLTDNFNGNTPTKITSLLNEEQKEIIETLGDSKSVLLKCERITDANSDSVTNVRGFMNKASNVLSLVFFDMSTEYLIKIAIYKSGDDDYYIYS